MSNLNEILNGLVDTDSLIISKIDELISTNQPQEDDRLDTINKNIVSAINELNSNINELNADMNELNADMNTLLREVGTFAIVGANTPGVSGTGVRTTDLKASDGVSYVYNTSTSANHILYGCNFSNVKFGKYAICARVKIATTNSAAIVQLKVLNGTKEILAKDFSGSSFNTTSNYCYLYSTFEYTGDGSTKKDLTFQLHLHKLNNIQVSFDYAYISLLTPSVFI